MATYYLDQVNGNNANSGADWANAWRTVTSGATAARIAPGDVVRIAKSPDPVSIGDGTWKDFTVAGAQLNIVSSTNATPIVLTVTSHGYSNGDIINVWSHNTNTNANNTWKVANVTTNTLELVGSVGNGVGGATGTVANFTNKSIVLATAQNKKIDDCEALWTVAGTSTIAGSTTVKQGYLSLSVTKAGPVTNTLYGYKALSGATNYSAYQGITFWIRNSVAITAGQWTLTLCSDAAGVTAVDTFDIPAIPSTATWVALTLFRNGGGNLGSSIQSIGLKTGATSPAAITILLDNIWACTTTGLSLNSLISKNSSAQGGTEPWLPIASMNYDGTVIVLDNGANTDVRGSRGYSGTAETVTTYHRQMIATDMVAAAGTIIASVQDSGTLGNNITFSGGWDTGSTTQNGETFFTGRNSLGIGMSLNTQSYISVEKLSFARYSNGFVCSTGVGNIIDLGDICGCQSTAYVSSSRPILCTNIRSVCNNVGIGMSIVHSNAIFQNIGVLACNLSTNLDIAGGFYNKLSVGKSNSSTTGVYFGSSSHGNVVNMTEMRYNSRGVRADLGTYNNIVVGVTSSNNTNSGIATFGGDVSIINGTFTDATIFETPTNYQDTFVSLFNYGAVAGDHRINTDNGSFATDTSTRHTASDFSWKSSPTTLRKSWYPLKLKIAEIACNSGSLVTFKAWVKLDHATNIASAIVCPGGQVGGVTSDQIANKAADTSWEELTITFTPTENKVVEIYQYSWYVAGNSSAYVDDITVTQA